MSVLSTARRPATAPPTPIVHPHTGRDRVTVATLWACLAMLLAPVVATDVLPLFDLPNHLARVQVLARWDAVEAFRANFVRDSLLIPNVLADVVLLAMAQATDVVTAGRILVGGCLVATGAGLYVMGRTAGGPANPWPLLALPLAVHEMVMWGFLNYLLGLAILFWAIAGWMVAQRWGRGRQLALGTVAAFALFLAHLVAFGLFAVAIATIEIHRVLATPRGRPAEMLGRLALSASIFVPALLVFALLSPSSGLPLDVRFDQTLWGRLSPYARLAATGNPILDELMLGGVAVIAIVGLLSGRAAPAAPLALVAIAWFALSQVLPFTAMGSYFLESRIAIAVAFMALASLRPVRHGRPEILLAVAVAALVLVRSAGLADVWRAEAVAVRPLLTALSELPRGAFVASGSALPFELGDWRQTRYRRPPEEHLGANATILADAVVPTLFARRGQNPLVFTPAHPALERLALSPGQRLDDPGPLSDFALDGVALASARGAPVFLVGFGVACDAWPGDLPLVPWACLPIASIVRALPADGPP